MLTEGFDGLKLTEKHLNLAGKTESPATPACSFVRCIHEPFGLCMFSNVASLATGQPL